MPRGRNRTSRLTRITPCSDNENKIWQYLSTNKNDNSQPEDKKTPFPNKITTDIKSKDKLIFKQDMIDKDNKTAELCYIFNSAPPIPLPWESL